MFPVRGVPGPIRQRPDGTLPLSGRLLLTLPVAAFTASLYALAGNPIRTPIHPQATWLDTAIPFIPASIYVYLPGYWLCFVMVLLVVRQGRDFRAGLFAALTTNAMAVPFFLFMPVASPRPLLHGDLTGTLALVERMYEIDTRYNTFPSLHVACSLLCAWMVWTHDRRIGAGLFAVAGAICASVLTLKQHWAVDIPGGAVLAGVGAAVWQFGRGLDQAAVARHQAQWRGYAREPLRRIGALEGLRELPQRLPERLPLLRWIRGRRR